MSLLLKISHLKILNYISVYTLKKYIYILSEMSELYYTYVSVIQKYSDTQVSDHIVNSFILYINLKNLAVIIKTANGEGIGTVVVVHIQITIYIQVEVSGVRIRSRVGTRRPQIGVVTHIVDRRIVVIALTCKCLNSDSFTIIFPKIIISNTIKTLIVHYCDSYQI